MASSNSSNSSNSNGVKHVAAYVRVSTAEQNEAGQKAEITNWLQQHGIDPALVKWYVDKKSGDSLDRPGFKKLQADIFSGQVSTVVIFRLDRLARKYREGVDALCDWVEKGVRVVSVSQAIDFNGTIGKIIAGVLIGFAEIEQEGRRERQRAGIEIAKKKGLYHGRKKGALKKGLDPARIIELRKKGLKISEICQSLGVARNTVFRYLREHKSK
jgi:DNA invertase Pin-like site-specific DNA recombinase